MLNSLHKMTTVTGWEALASHLRIHCYLSVLEYTTSFILGEARNELIRVSICVCVCMLPQLIKVDTSMSDMSVYHPQSHDTKTWHWVLAQVLVQTIVLHNPVDHHSFPNLSIRVEYLLPSFVQVIFGSHQLLDGLCSPVQWPCQVGTSGSQAALWKPVTGIWHVYIL